MATDYDVIIIGAGGAGLSAAVSANALGGRVLLVEAGSQIGGSTALSGGVFYAAGTSLQREAGIADDTSDAAYHYYMTLNQYKIDPALVRRLCDDAPQTFEWLRAIGVSFTVDGLYASGVDKIRRGHRAEGGGAAITQALEGQLSGKGVDIALNTRVSTLLIEQERVAGITVDGENIRSEAVVMATGGFGANPTMLEALYPDAAAHGGLHWYIGAPTCRGDGITMATATGAKVTTPNRGLLLLTPGFAKDLESYLPGWLMMVNRDGRRFIDETIEYSVLSAALNEQTDRECFGIFDESARAEAKTTRHRPAPNWTADRLQDFANSGLLKRAGTLDDLAAMIDVPPATLATSVARYNRNADTSRDSDFFKPNPMLRPIRTPPFYAARIRAAIICWTGTGLRIEVDAHVLDAADRPIPGLFAAGETTGGMFGECYASGGASIGNAIIFGRVAGHNAMRNAKGIDTRSD